MDKVRELCLQGGKKFNPVIECVEETLELIEDVMNTTDFMFGAINR